LPCDFFRRLAFANPLKRSHGGGLILDYVKQLIQFGVAKYLLELWIDRAKDELASQGFYQLMGDYQLAQYGGWDGVHVGERYEEVSARVGSDQELQFDTQFLHFLHITRLVISDHD
jgi:hypothetical protein